jgi:hypothetical protein
MLGWSSSRPSLEKRGLFDGGLSPSGGDGRCGHEQAWRRNRQLPQVGRLPSHFVFRRRLGSM